MKKTGLINRIGKAALAIAVAAAFIIPAVPASAAEAGSIPTGISFTQKAEGLAKNHDGVSNVSQFSGADGNYCFAYCEGKTVTVVKTDGESITGTVKLELQKPKFGAVTCDSSGNYYIVSGKDNSGSDTSVKTIFVTKYSSSGKVIKTVGNNGRSSLLDYYEKRFNTQEPFYAGNCDVAMNGKYLAVNYARKMYSGHQSNSAWIINTSTMKTIHCGKNYNSHSFAQRVIPYKSGFLFASEGDCYPRSFTSEYMDYKQKKVIREGGLFSFWVRSGALDDFDMVTVNNNFAHMGGIVKLSDSKAAFVGTSAKSLNSDAKSEKENVFVQVYYPAKNLSKSTSYVTKGKRSGKGGANGDESVTDYGVKWLTSSTGTYTYSNPQVAGNGKDRIVVLFERNQGSSYNGVYYMVLDGSGNEITKETLYSRTAKLNSCEMPVYKNGTVYWTGNSTSGDGQLYVYKLKL